MDRKELAVDLKHNGHNCCQSVLCAFADELKISTEELDRMGAGFGVGMGCMEATCGALVGAQMVLGLKTFQGKPILKDAAAIHNEFKTKCGASICKDLKGRDTGKILCECDDCVRNAVEIIDKSIN